MPFCPKCGKEVSSEADFCYYCCQSLPKARPSSETKPVPPAQPITASPPQPIPKESPLHTSHGTRNIAIAAILIIIAVAGGFVVYSFINGFHNIVTTSPIGQGSMSIQSGQIFQGNTDYVLVDLTNTGTKNLTIANAFIDNEQASVSGSLNLGIGQQITLTVTPSSGQNIVDGATHILKVVASDGTFVTISVVYTPPQQGVLSIDSGQVTATGITIYVRNIGSITETLNSVYVDNVLIPSSAVSFTPATIAPNQVCTVIITGSGWNDGSSHIVKIVASDGTPVTFSVHA